MLNQALLKRITVKKTQCSISPIEGANPYYEVYLMFGILRQTACKIHADNGKKDFNQRHIRDKRYGGITLYSNVRF